MMKFKKKIHKSLIFIVLVCFSITSLSQSRETIENKNPGIGSDEESNQKSKISQVELNINKAIAEAYKVWFVKKGDAPDFSKFNDYYTSTAVFQKYTGDSVIVSLISDGVKEFKDAFKAGHLNSFDEREIGSETTQFGDVAHRISYHIYHTNSNDSITARGVNSIQLVKTNGKWKVQSILRQFESDAYQLPEEYDSFK